MVHVDDEDIDLLDFFSNEEGDSSSTYRDDHSRDGTMSSNALPSSKTTNLQASSSAEPLSRRSSPYTPLTGASPSPSSNNGQQGSVLRTPTPPPPRKKHVAPPLVDFAEGYSGLRVRNRLLSAEDMRVRMKGRKVHRLAGMKAVPTRALESQDPSDAWAVLGVLVSKSPRRQAANGGSYAIWTLSDLSRKENDVSVFLFQEALSSHWTVCEGTLLAILSAKVLPPKESGGGGGGGTSNQKLAFSVDSPWQVFISRSYICSVCVH